MTAATPPASVPPTAESQMADAPASASQARRTAVQSGAGTPGRAAYEGAIAEARAQGSDSAFADWADLEDWQQGRHEAAAQAVLNQAFPGLRRQLDEARAERLRLAGERDEARSDYGRLRAVLESRQSDAAARKLCLAILATAGTPGTAAADGVSYGEIFQRAHGGDIWANLGPAGQACAQAGAEAVAMDVMRRWEAQPARVDLLGKRFFHLASELENEAACTLSREAAQALRLAAQRIRKALDTDQPPGKPAPERAEQEPLMGLTETIGSALRDYGLEPSRPLVVHLVGIVHGYADAVSAHREFDAMEFGGQLAAEPKPAPELAAATAKCDRLEGQCEDLREERGKLRVLVAEILADFWPGERFEGISEGLRDCQARVDDYRERAGLPS